MPRAHHLSPAQQRALALLSAGSTATAAAQFVGVHRNTVGNWLRSTAFREALIEIRRDQDLAWREQARSLAPQALGAIQAILADPQAPKPRSPSKAACPQNRPPHRTPHRPPQNPPPPSPAATSPAHVAADGNSSVAACPFVDSKDQNGFVRSNSHATPNAQTCTISPKTAQFPRGAGRPLAPAL